MTAAEMQEQFDIQIVEAKLEQGRARVLNFGPSGCGKTFTGLLVVSAWAELLKGKARKEKPVVIDSENRTAAKYAKRFNFDAIYLRAPFSPDHYIAALRVAAAQGYGVCLIDSISHEWMGEGGVQEIVDEATARMGGNKWGGWAVGTPAHNRFLEAILSSPMHIFATARAKTEWIQQDGKPKKIGLAPVQREGIDYEFDIVLRQDLDHSVVVEKSRAEFLEVQSMIQLPDVDLANAMMQWLQLGEPPAEPTPEPAKVEHQSTNGAADETAAADEEKKPKQTKQKAATKGRITKLLNELQTDHADFTVANGYERGLVEVADKEAEGGKRPEKWEERIVSRLPEQFDGASTTEDLSEEQAAVFVTRLQDTIALVVRAKEDKATAGALV